MFRHAWKVLRKFFPLCYKQLIALSPRRIKDKFSPRFCPRRQFCENFENTSENTSLIPSQAYHPLFLWWAGHL